MGYPKKLLADDEVIVYELRPHWRALVAPAFVFLLSIAVGTYLLAVFGTGDEVWTSAVRWIVGLAMLFSLVVWVLRPFAFWWTTQYVFTDHRIIVRTGLIARKGRDMPLSRVNDVSFEHGMVERFLNCGTLIVESAGTQGQLVIRSVPNIEQIQRDIYRLHDEDDDRRRRRSDEPDPERGPGRQAPAPRPSED
ncbi:unannotated protein [freshwater metagenome]|jgi:uncharacterized membrane protein YdbT with pleckstrin-like domain|uniref:Unannotated protein n=1 Tax=freshwater metagenome TaxID=449393 RepID=A0A6J7RPD8_9ZZZZ|nr:PH domain-containing protein [Actinomycetota bacterium]MSW35825.1 PH domain-containing protein [Actinomycetota bacterium]MSX38125.1 PH domain-containing protein [Actinomycetota bacterium]